MNTFKMDSCQNSHKIRSSPQAALKEDMEGLKCTAVHVISAFQHVTNKKQQASFSLSDMALNMEGGR